MTLKRPKGPGKEAAGALVVLEHGSRILEGNPLGGNRYVNSPAIGDYADTLTREIIPFVDREFRTLAGREHRGCFGKSSGGYGAILHGMKTAKYWGAVADHSGDTYFDFVYRHDWPNTLNELAKHRAPKRKAGVYDARREAGRKGLAQGMDDGRTKRFLAHKPLHGGDLRPRSARAARLSDSVQRRIGGGDRGALEELAPPRPGQSRLALPGQPEVTARHLHRLRLARPVPYPLRLAHPVVAPCRGGHPAPI
jgi:hypothetical protein